MMTGAALCLATWLGDELGYYRAPANGEARLRQVFEDAGYTHLRRATETPLNMILEARA
jgi:hypothetical protein